MISRAPKSLRGKLHLKYHRFLNLSTATNKQELSLKYVRLGDLLHEREM